MSYRQKIFKLNFSNFILKNSDGARSLPSVIGSLYVSLAPSLGGMPQLRATASTTVFVNLLDLNDNDPKFLNLPFVAEVPEGLLNGSAVFKVELQS